MKINKGDSVLVIKGKSRGKTGKVSFSDPKSKKVIVEGVNIYKAHVKPSNKYPQGGIIDKNMPLAIENVMVICPGCKKVTKVKVKGDGRDKKRICAKCMETLDAIK